MPSTFEDFQAGFEHFEAQANLALWYDNFKTPQCAFLTDCCGCGREGSRTAFFDCPLCREQGQVVVSIFCCQQCFRANWHSHKAWHERFTPDLQNPTPIARPFPLPTVTQYQFDSMDQDQRDFISLRVNAIHDINEGRFRQAQKRLVRQSRMMPWKYSVTQDLSHCFEQSGHPSKALGLMLETLPRQAFKLFCKGRNRRFFYAIARILQLASHHPDLNPVLPLWIRHKGLLSVVWRGIMEYLLLELPLLVQHPNTITHILEGALHYHDRLMANHPTNAMQEANAGDLRHHVAFALDMVSTCTAASLPSRIGSSLRHILTCLMFAENLVIPPQDRIWHEDLNHNFRIGCLVRVYDNSVGLLCQPPDDSGRCTVQLEEYPDPLLFHPTEMTALDYPECVSMCFATCDPETLTVLATVKMSSVFPAL